MIGLYAIVSEAPREAVGARGEPLRSLSAGPLIALIGEPSPAVTPESLRSHDAALRRIAAQVEACLPARYGATAADEEALRRELGDRATELAAALELVRGREQMTLRVVGSDALREPSQSGGPGTRYLEERRRVSRMPELDPLRAALHELVRAEKVDRQGSLASVYHLIDRGAAETYSAIVNKTSLSPLRVLVSGPWPAWSFAPEVAP